MNPKHKEILRRINLGIDYKQIVKDMNTTYAIVTQVSQTHFRKLIKVKGVHFGVKQNPFSKNEMDYGYNLPTYKISDFSKEELKSIEESRKKYSDVTNFTIFT